MQQQKLFCVYGPEISSCTRNLAQVYLISDHYISLNSQLIIGSNYTKDHLFYEFLKVVGITYKKRYLVLIFISITETRLFY